MKLNCTASIHRLSSLLPVLFLSLNLLAGCARSGDVPTVASALKLTPSEASCAQKMEARFIKDEREQVDWYMNHGGIVPGPKHRARFVAGTNGHAVVLIHGFLSSPERMSEIAEPLIQKGYTVYLSLMTGFSAGPEAANASGTIEWRESVRNAIDTVKLCHEDVAIIAHSLGAAVAMDELMNRNLGGVSKLVLLAPYFHTYGDWLNILNAIVKSRTDVLDIDVVRRWIGGDPYTYLPIERPKEGEAEPFLPLIALNRVLDLQYTFRRPAKVKLKIPVLVALAASDLVIDSRFAEEYLVRNFESVNQIVYDDQSEIGHSLQVRMNNPRFDELLSAILAELESQIRSG